MDIRTYIQEKSHDLKSRQDSVRNIISNHWGEDGRYKELILKQWLKDEFKQRKLGVEIGTGFIKNHMGEVSSQIDIIIYNPKEVRHYLPQPQQDDFIIIDANSVLAILEVKTRINPYKKDKKDNKDIIESLCDNKKLAGGDIFAGIFAYECQERNKQVSDKAFEKVLKGSNEKYKKALERTLKELSPIDCIAFGENYFMKFWQEQEPDSSYQNKHYSFYRLENQSFGYFMLNICEHILVCLNKDRMFSQDELNRIYPEGTKEPYKLLDFSIENGWVGTANTHFHNFGVNNDD